MNWINEIVAWIKRKTKVMAAGSKSSNPMYNAKNKIAQIVPITNDVTWPTMVIPFVRIRNWITSLDRPVEVKILKWV